MLSIIICSISPERLQTLETNIQQTIHAEYEIIAVDNRERKWPIAKAYNYAAGQAKYPYLFFVHEDVMFHSCDWGEYIERKLCESDCGVIGFVGGKVMLNCYSGWNQHYEWVCCHLYQRQGDLSRFDVCNVYLQSPFAEVVTVDGLGMFVRKDVWAKFPFDEALLTGFHGYDIDFSLQIVKSGNYKNYICCSSQVLIEHFSAGTFDSRWIDNTVCLYKNKWSKILPVAVDGWLPTPEAQEKREESLSYEFLKKALKFDSSYKAVVLKDFWHRPYSWKHFCHCIKMTFKFLVS